MLDEVLATRAHNGDDEARDRLLKRSMPILRKMSMTMWAPGSDQGDMMSTAMMGYIRAVETWDDKKRAAWTAFLRLNVRAAMIAHLKCHTRMADGPLNNAVPLTLPTEEGDEMDIPQQVRDEDGYRQIEDQAETLSLLEEIASSGWITPVDWDIIRTRATHPEASYADIGKMLGKDEKYADNRWYVLRRRLKALVSILSDEAQQCLRRLVGDL